MKLLFSFALIATAVKLTISTVAADVASEVNSILNDTIVTLAGGDSSKVAATADGVMHIFTALSTAASLSLFFFKCLFGFMIRMTMYVISPVLWISGFFWRQFVTRPLDLFLHVLHVLYPVIMFCIAAICCGVFIGGCAGFAAEAFSSILISATWGPQATKRIEQEENIEVVEALPEKNKESFSHDSDTEQLDEEQYNLYSQTNSRSSSFFGSTTIRSSKGKEPLIPRVESWRDSLSTSSTSSSPALIRRMKLSTTPTAPRHRKNSWEWDEDTEEEVEFSNNDSLKNK